MNKSSTCKSILRVWVTKVTEDSENGNAWKLTEALNY